MLQLYEIRTRAGEQRAIGLGHSPGHFLEECVRGRYDLSGADLRSLDLSQCDLRGAKLEGANLRDCVFRHADLRGADLRGATCEQTNFTGADCEYARFDGAAFDRYRFAAADLDYSSFEECNFDAERHDFWKLLSAAHAWCDFDPAEYLTDLLYEGKFRGYCSYAGHGPVTSELGLKLGIWAMPHMEPTAERPSELFFTGVSVTTGEANPFYRLAMSWLGTYRRLNPNRGVLYAYAGAA